MALNDKQRRFADEYLIDLNATKAAERAGYSPKTANEQGARLLANVSVQALLTECMQARAKRTEITQDRVLQEIARIAFFDPRTLVDEEGKPIPLKQLDADSAAVVAGLKLEMLGAVREYKIADKLKALDQCMSHLGMGKTKVELTGSGGGPVLTGQVTPEQLAEAVRNVRDKF